MPYRIITAEEAAQLLQDETADPLPFQFVNEAGIQEINEFLGAHHKQGGNFTPDMLAAWARQAEFQLGEGNPACIELKSWDSTMGRTEEFRISDSGISWGITA